MPNLTYNIASIPGDGIGKEVLPSGQKIVTAVQDRFGFKVEWSEFDWSCEQYLKTGQMMPSDGISRVGSAFAHPA